MRRVPDFGHVNVSLCKIRRLWHHVIAKFEVWNFGVAKNGYHVMRLKLAAEVNAHGGDAIPCWGGKCHPAEEITNGVLGLLD